jgi:carbonic anhydrase
MLDARYPGLDSHECLERLSKLNVLEQLANLHTHPMVESRLQDDRLSLHGWYYEIHTGRVEAYNQKIGLFEELI